MCKQLSRPVVAPRRRRPWAIRRGCSRRIACSRPAAHLRAMQGRGGAWSDAVQLKYTLRQVHSENIDLHDHLSAEVNPHRCAKAPSGHLSGSGSRCRIQPRGLRARPRLEDCYAQMVISNASNADTRARRATRPMFMRSKPGDARAPETGSLHLQHADDRVLGSRGDRRKTSKRSASFS
jgi:hypothetical protein